MKNLYLLIITILIIFSGCTSKNELVIVKDETKYGVKDASGNLLVKPSYDFVSTYENPNDENIKNGLIHPFNLHWIHNYYGTDRYSLVEYKNKFGIVDIDGSLIVKPIYDYISKLYNDFFVVIENGKYGYMNSNFELVQKPIFIEALPFDEEIAFVKLFNSKWACINNDMKLIIDAQFDNIYPKINGFSRVQVANKWSFIDENCKLINEVRYDYVSDFSNGIAKVKIDGKIGYINEDGQTIVDEKYKFGQNY